MFVPLRRFMRCLCLQQKAACEISFSSWKKRSLQMQSVAAACQSVPVWAARAGLALERGSSAAQGSSPQQWHC